MDRVYHRHALRHLDVDLIERIYANGPQKRATKPAALRKKKVRSNDSYRAAKRNEQRGLGWPIAAVVKKRPLIMGRKPALNRSQNWPAASSYAEARANAPDPTRLMT